MAIYIGKTGLSTNLASTPIENGFLLSTDDGALYLDYDDGSNGTRFNIVPKKSDSVKSVTLEAGPIIKVTTQDGQSEYYQVPTFTAATDAANGTKGLVPAPTMGQQNKYLKGNGTWADIEHKPPLVAISWTGFQSKKYADIIADMGSTASGYIISGNPDNSGDIVYNISAIKSENSAEPVTNELVLYDTTNSTNEFSQNIKYYDEKSGEFIDAEPYFNARWTVKFPDDSSIDSTEFEDPYLVAVSASDDSSDGIVLLPDNLCVYCDNSTASNVSQYSNVEITIEDTLNPSYYTTDTAKMDLIINENKYIPKEACTVSEDSGSTTWSWNTSAITTFAASSQAFSDYDYPVTIEFFVPNMKNNIGYTFTSADTTIADIVPTIVGYGSDSTELESTITQLQSTVATLQEKLNSLAIADVSGLQTALDDKAVSDHTHEIADITNLQTTLDGKAASTHTHAIADVTNLQTTLNGKLSTTGTAAAANKLATARTITLGSDCSGSVSFDGSTNVTLNVTVKDDSHNHTIANVDNLQSQLNTISSNATSAKSVTDKYSSMLNIIGNNQ